MNTRGRIAESGYTNLRLKDHIRPDLNVLFVGINPGVRSAVIGHHFAGYSNRFWKLLNESGLTPHPLGYETDDQLLSWNLGITNLIARPTPGISELRPDEYVAGWKVLERKIRRYRPKMIALVGVTLYRAILPLLRGSPDTTAVKVPGLQSFTIQGSTLFVLPNPSGRNANFTYREMLGSYIQLRRWIDER